MIWSDDRVANAAGVLDERFGSVGDAFVENFADGLELGACFAVMIDGELVVDIRGGHADKAKETPWTEDTIACIFSSGKAVLSLLVAQAVSDGAMNYDCPVAEYWAEFAQNGKVDITVAELLSHQAGLCAIAEEMSPETWLDWDAITGRLAAMAPMWEPCTANGYHPQTFGFLAGELLRRTTGKSVKTLLADCNARYDTQIFCGMSEAQIARAAFMPKPPKAPDLGELNEFTKLAFLSKWASTARVSRDVWMAAEIPASNMHADARSLARILHAFVNEGAAPDGEVLLNENAIAAALKERIRGDDLVLPFNLSWAAGMMRNTNRHFGPNESALGHAGFGGSAVLIDPDNNLTAAYVMNKMSPYLVGDPRSVRPINAVYDCL